MICGWDWRRMMALALFIGVLYGLAFVARWALTAAIPQMWAAVIFVAALGLFFYIGAD